MCDPLVGGLITGALSLGGGMYEASQQAAAEQDLMDKQNAANAQWVAYQNQIHKQQVAAEETQRTQANTARESTLANFTPQAQEAQQSAEAQRLNTLYTSPQTQSPTNASPTSMLLSGESSGNKNFMDNLTQQVNTATSQARGRIASLATANSFGGSFGGLGTTDPIEMQQGANQINLSNAIRNANLKTYGVEQQVQPVNYTMGASFGSQGALGKTLAGLGGTLFGQSAGKGGLGSLFGGSGGNVPVITDGSAGGW